MILIQRQGQSAMGNDTNPETRAIFKATYIMNTTKTKIKRT
jgi:hypothetical protein